MAYHYTYRAYRGSPAKFTAQCTGPRAPTPDTFADALFNDNSSWAVTDRGPIEALAPITRVLENTIEFMEDSNPDKDSPEVQFLRLLARSLFRDTKQRAFANVGCAQSFVEREKMLDRQQASDSAD